MAEPIVSFLLETIANLLIEEVKFLGGVSDEAEHLHSELKMMRALLKDADEKQHEFAIVKEWVSQCRDLAYEAEDVLETHAFKLASRQRARGTKNVFWRFARMLTGCYVRHNVGLEIQTLSTRVSNLTRRFQEYGIRFVIEKDGSSSRQQQLRMTYSYVADDEDFVGLQPEVEKLAQVLTSEDDSSGQNGVVSIFGMGGSGKTTLARKVYNHPNVKHHFDNFAWVCISQQWQTTNILQGILVSFLPDRRGEIEKWRDDELVEQLVRVQQNKKCLVVLDDIWSADAWECIKDAFSVRNKGNKILLTTRNKDVAERVGPNGYHYQLRLLDTAESWKLLQKKALFRGRPSQEYGDIHELQKLGKEMVKSCGGLPLAVIVLGGILATKHTFNEWNVVYKNIKTYLGRGGIKQQQGKVQNILAFSYNDLPYKLKPCFLYFSGFHEDMDIPTKHLYYLWISEGLVYAEDRIGEESMIDVAERYLGELVKRCIVHVKVVESWPSIRKFASCSLHDLMRDLCLEKAREENFLKVIDHGHGNQDIHELAKSTSPSSGNIHRLMIYLGDEIAQSYALPEIKASKHLRTLALFAHLFPLFGGTLPGFRIQQLAESQLNRFKMLRSLIIEGMITPGLNNSGDMNITPDDTFKLSIDDLIHLRYLCLRNSKLVISPSSINNLEHLETLDLSDAEILWTTNVPLRMQRLRYLHLNSLNNFSLQIYVSSNLETLIGFDPRKHDVRDFSELTNLQKLEATMAEGKYVEEIINYISYSQKIRQAIIWNEILSPEMEPSLQRRLLCSKLQYLSFFGTLGGELPKYDSQFFRNLLELAISGSEFQDDPMQVLQKLPNLQCLCLGYNSFCGKEMVCSSNGFPQLRFLLIRWLPNLESWRVEKGAMPNLSRLEISYCYKLSMIPDGLRFIEPLKELLIEELPEEFGNRLRMVDGREGEDFDKVRHVPSIMITKMRPLQPFTFSAP